MKHDTNQVHWRTHKSEVGAWWTYFQHLTYNGAWGFTISPLTAFTSEHPRLPWSWSCYCLKLLTETQQKESTWSKMGTLGEEQKSPNQPPEKDPISRWQGAGHPVHLLSFKMKVLILLGVTDTAQAQGWQTSASYALSYAKWFLHWVLPSHNAALPHF